MAAQSRPVSAAPTGVVTAARPAKGPARRTPEGGPISRARGISRSSRRSSARASSARSRCCPTSRPKSSAGPHHAGQQGPRDGTADQDVARAYNDFWWDFGTRVAKQASLVVDPPTAGCRLSPPTAQKKAASQTPRYDNVEERPLAERCILGFNSGPPMMPSAYNNNMQLVQTPTQVLILNEMVHSARVIDVSGPSASPASMASDRRLDRPLGRQHAGGRYDQLLNGGNFRFSTRDMHLIERFSLEDDQTLRYEFTMDDPAVWTSKWVGVDPDAPNRRVISSTPVTKRTTGWKGCSRARATATRQANDRSRRARGRSHLEVGG